MELIEKVILVLDDENIFSPEYKVPSMAVQDKVFELSHKNTEELFKLTEKYKAIEKYAKGGQISIEDMNANEVTEAMKQQAEITKINNKYTVEMFKAMVITKKLNEAETKAIQSEFNSPFWYSQDIIKIREAVTSFRQKLKC